MPGRHLLRVESFQVAFGPSDQGGVRGDDLIRLASGGITDPECRGVIPRLGFIRSSAGP